MTVVGHCPTDLPGRGYMDELRKEPRYTGCDAGGCVLVGCERDDGPGLAFVDITMSRAFRSGNPNDRGRRGDLLYLTHIDGAPDTRFYNRVYRINTGIMPPVAIQIYPESHESPDPRKSLLRGGRRYKRTIRKKAYRDRKSSRRNRK